MGIKFIPHGDRFSPGVVDTDWLPVAGEERWAVLTADKRIRFNELEIAQVIDHGVRQFVFSSGLGIPVKVNIDSGGKPNGVPE